MKPKRTNYEQTHQHARTHAVTRIHGHATNSKHPYALREQFYCAVLQFTPLLDRPVTLTPTPTGLCPGGGAGKLRRDDHVVDVLHHPPLEVAAAPCRRARGTRLSSSPAAASVAAQLRDRDLDSAAPPPAASASIASTYASRILAISRSGDSSTARAAARAFQDDRRPRRTAASFVLRAPPAPPPRRATRRCRDGGDRGACSSSAPSTSGCCAAAATRG